MGQRRRSKLRFVLGLGLSCILVYALLLKRVERQTLVYSASAKPPDNGSKSTQRINSNLSLEEEQCAETFPGLTKEVEDFVEQGPFDLALRDGYVLQGKIEDGQLIIIRAPGKGELSSTMRHRQSAILQQLHRAIITSPAPLPTTYFAFAVHDQPLHSSLSFARPTISPSHKRILPMPHFSFWSWPLPFVTSLPAAQRAIDRLEDTIPFPQKDPKAVWRGTTWFNNGAGTHPRLRQDLIAMVPRDAAWADVQPLLRGGDDVQEMSNAIPISSFCNYRYIVHTEGIGYSGRLQFHQLCASVLLTPAPEWMQHTTHLMRPILSSTLLNAPSHASKRVREAWPVEYDLDEANVVFVAPDWSDLEDTVGWLEGHLEAAEGIARRQRERFARGGYLTPAAEVCYWRALIRGWSEVARPIGWGWDGKGVPFEEFITGTEDGNR